MTITLGPEHEQLIAEALGTGAYRNPDEVIGRALEMLHSEDEWLQDQKDLIEGRIERGELLSPEGSRADMEKRKADWLTKRRGS